MESKAEFVARFGGIFEHSPWVAERAFGDRKAANSSDIHVAMTRAFRAASHAERLAVLRAHPDLAGKLAQARRLTRDSTSEQASAGLDALTDAERDEFTRLNKAYTSKFGFPFIIAVRGLNKMQILSSFKDRIHSTSEQEFETACAQVEKIARLRLDAMFP